VLFEMLTGGRPFAGEHEITVAHAILHGKPGRASALRAGIPAALDDLVHTLLRKDPAKRYQSAEEVATAVAAIRLDGRHARSWVLRRPGRFSPSPWRVSWRAGVLASIALVAISLGGWLAHRSMTTTAGPLALAVLPFKEPGGEENRYLAVGLADAIRTELTRLRGLIVPAYITMSGSDALAKPLRQIAAEQNVSALLLGSVHRAGGRVRVEVQLLDAKGGKQLWGQRYERPLSELVDIQREATRATVAALRLRLTTAERALLEQPLTTHAQAWDAYLRGRAVELAGLPRDLFAPRPTDNIRRAQSLYSRARDLDPGFAVARARLALMHTVSAATYDTTEARREQARLEAETALRLRPGLPEAHEALGNYWDRRGDLASAIDESKRALEGFPNSADLRLGLGSRYARAGRLEDAVAEFEHAMRLEPGSPMAAAVAAVFYLRLRRDVEGMRAFDRAIALAPDYHMVKVIKGHTYLRWKGTPDTLAAALRSIPADWDPDGMATYARYTALRVQRRYADALAMLDASRSELSRDGLVYQPMPLIRAQLHEGLGERAKARANYAAARALLLDSLDAHPDDPSIRAALGLAYAGLGRKSEAVREARRAMELVPLASNTPAATAFMGIAVEAFAKAGEVGAAMELLELLFAMPAGREVTVAFLRVWPGFDPLRSDPRFEELLERFASQ
jgi:TolB-like protein/Flp pilus assembly protein TadD